MPGSALAPERADSQFPPYSNDRKDWIPFNRKTANKIRSAAKGSKSGEVVALAEPVVALGVSKSWAALLERRGEDFHRWRPQSHGMTGVSKATPWKHESSGSRSMGFGGFPDYLDAKDLGDKTGLIATAAMFALADAMEEFSSAWPAASVRLGGPHFKIKRST